MADLPPVPTKCGIYWFEYLCKLLGVAKANHSGKGHVPIVRIEGGYRYAHLVQKSLQSYAIVNLQDL